MSAYIENDAGVLVKKHKTRAPDPHKTYVQQAQLYPMLSAEEEADLIKQYHVNKNTRALDRIIKSHLRLLVKIAQGFQGYGYPLEDLISEGHIGMMQAVNNFDDSKGARFSTYATWWIRASIQEYILKSWSIVRFSANADQKKLFYRLRSTKTRLGLDRLQSLSDAEAQQVAQVLEVTADQVLDMDQRLNGSDFSLNAYIQAEEGSEWQDWLSDDMPNQEERFAEQDETQKRTTLLALAFQKLSERELQIFKWRRLGEPRRSLEEIALEMNLSRERIRQIEEIAFDKVQRIVLKQARAKGMHPLTD